MIQLFNVSKTYFGEVEVEALKDINLHIKRAILFSWSVPVGQASLL